MAERHSWAVQQVDGVGQVSVEDARYAAGALWTPEATVTHRTGVVPAQGTPGQVTASDPTPDGRVHVAPFHAVLQSGRGGGVYTMTLDSTKTVDVLGDAPADPSDDRIDLVVWQQNDAYHGDPDSDMVVRHVVGTPAATPTRPTVDGSSDYIDAAEIYVAAGATTLDAAAITNQPLPWTVPTGGVLPVRDQAELDAVAAPYAGMAAWRRDENWLCVWDGGSWRVVGVPVVTFAADLPTIPGAYVGQVAYVEADMVLHAYTSAGWRSMATQRRGRYLTTVSGATMNAYTVYDLVWDDPVHTLSEVTLGTDQATFTVQQSGLVRFRCEVNIGGASTTSDSTVRNAFLRDLQSGDTVAIDQRRTTLAEDALRVDTDYLWANAGEQYVFRVNQQSSEATTYSPRYCVVDWSPAWDA